jgi:hypothetical protein
MRRCWTSKAWASSACRALAAAQSPHAKVTTDRPWPLFDVAATRRIEQAGLASLPSHTLMQRAGLATARLGLAVAPHARASGSPAGPATTAATDSKPPCTWRSGARRWSSPGRRPCRLPADAKLPGSASPMPGLAPAHRHPAGVGPVHRRAARHRRHAAVAGQLALDGRGDVVNAGAGDRHRRPERPGCRHRCGRVRPRDAHAGLLTLKPGLFTGGGRDAAGQVWFDDLGVAPARGAAAPCSPASPPASPAAARSHKGSYGDVAVIGGAPGMLGAAQLAPARPCMPAPAASSWRRSMRLRLRLVAGCRS